MDFCDGHTAARPVACVDTAGKNRGRALETGMVEEQASQLSASVACDSHNRGL
jgi:hypothetical protein